MKIVIIGGSGLIGKKLVKNLRQRGHEVIAASPSSGVNTLTGEGLAEALADASVVAPRPDSFRRLAQPLHLSAVRSHRRRRSTSSIPSSSMSQQERVSVSRVCGLTMRCSEPGHCASVAIHASGGPGR
jgi:NAD(P)-dependent dehydrogenase (short-subunit alcohol dehydrogenase family)